MLTPSKLGGCNTAFTLFPSVVKGQTQLLHQMIKDTVLEGSWREQGWGRTQNSEKKCKNNLFYVTIQYILNKMYLFSPWYRAVKVHIYMQEDLLVEDMPTGATCRSHLALVYSINNVVRCIF